MLLAACGKKKVDPPPPSTSAQVVDPDPPKRSGTCDPGPSPGPTSAKDECATHADCKVEKHGRCVRAKERNTCVYDHCTSDQECRSLLGSASPHPEHIVCGCRKDDPAETYAQNMCGEANCVTDADCPAPYTCEGPSKRRFCHAPGDACQKHADCPANHACRYNLELQRYVCLSLVIHEREGTSTLPLDD